MAKYGMSMCVLGMADELKSKGVAVNALWPRTAISTAAMEMLGGDEALHQCRTVDIMADAAYYILTKNSHDNTGNFYVDEDILRECGVENFDRYAVKPGKSCKELVLVFGFGFGLSSHFQVVLPDVVKSY